MCITTTASTTTTSKPPEEGGTYNYPVPEDSLILPTKNTPSSSATDKKQAKKTFSPQPKKTVPAGKSVTSVVEFQSFCIHELKITKSGNSISESKPTWVIVGGKKK